MRTRRTVLLKSKPKYAIVVDGDCEFWYIQMLKRNERSIVVNLEPKIPQRKKLNDQFQNVLELSKDYDKVFWIIDFDVIVSETRNAKKGSKTALTEFKEFQEIINTKYDNITIIINNPCLEFWLLLHFESTSKYFDICEGALRQLKKHLPDYEKTQKFYTKQDNDIYMRLRPLLNIALENAMKLNKFDIHNPLIGISQMQLFFNTAEIKTHIEKK